MFGVSVLISDFPPYLLDEIFSQILAAVGDLARRDFCRLDRCNVGAAHVAIYCSVFAVVEAGHDAKGQSG